MLQAAANNGKFKLFKTCHRRFGHLGKQRLADLHKVTTLSTPIPITMEEDHVCDECALKKIKNKKGHYLSDRKSANLSFVSIDVYPRSPVTIRPLEHCSPNRSNCPTHHVYLMTQYRPLSRRLLR